MNEFNLSKVHVIAEYIVIGSLFLSGCTSSDIDNNRNKLALGGAVLGGIVGNNVGDGDNVVLGSAIGAVLGGILGNSMDRSKEQLNSRLNNLEYMSSTVTVIVENRNGSFTPVNLTSIGSGLYRGPRGEVYRGIPSNEQLKSVYGM